MRLRRCGPGSLMKFRYREEGRMRLWPHWSWPAALVVVGVTVAGGAAAITLWPHAWWWLTLITAVSVAVVPPVTAAASQGLQRRQQIARTTRAGLQQTTGAIGGAIPSAGEADLGTRVHQ